MNDKWGAIGALVGVAGLAFAAGAWYVGNQSNLGGLEERLDELSGKISALEQRPAADQSVYVRQEDIVDVVRAGDVVTIKSAANQNFAVRASDEESTEYQVSVKKYDSADSTQRFILERQKD